MQQEQFGAEFSVCLLLYNFPVFSENFTNIDTYANYLHIRPSHRMKTIYVSFNLLASLIVYGKLLMRYESLCRHRPTFFKIAFTPSTS